MRRNFFLRKLFEHPHGSGTSRPRKINFRGRHELFGHHPFAWKTPTPLGGLRTQIVNLCALFSCLTNLFLALWEFLAFPFRMNAWEFAKGGGAKRIMRFWGGGNVLSSAPSKTSFGGLRKWDLSGLCPSPLTRMTLCEQRGGKSYHKWGGPKPFLGRGFMVWFPLP